MAASSSRLVHGVPGLLPVTSARPDELPYGPHDDSNALKELPTVKIKYHNNGAESHVRPELGRELIRAGLAVEIPNKSLAESLREQHRPMTPEWSVIRDEGGYVAIKMEMGTTSGHNIVGGHLDPRQKSVVTKSTPSRVGYFSGDPKKIHDRKNSAGEFCSAFGLPVPQEIIDQYARLWAKESNRAPQMPYSLSAMAISDANKEHAERLAKKNADDKVVAAARPDVQEKQVVAAQEAANIIDYKEEHGLVEVLNDKKPSALGL